MIKYTTVEYRERRNNEGLEGSRKGFASRKFQLETNEEL